MNDQTDLQLANGRGLTEWLPGPSAHNMGCQFIRTGEGNKGYYQDMRGRLARVSSVSAAVVDKGGALAGWAAKVCALWLERNLPRIFETEWGGRAPNKVQLADLVRRMKSEHRYVKEEAGDIGTLVHEWIRAYVRGFKQPLPPHPQAAAACTAFIGWGRGINTLRGYQLMPIATETMLLHPRWRIAGTADFVGLHLPMDAKRDPATGVWSVDPRNDCSCTALYAVRDWKTASGAYIEQLLQAILYACCIEEMWGVKVGSVGAVVCTKQGQLILTNADIELTDRDREAAEAAVKVASYCKPELWRNAA